jgi:hypothetical protein
MFLCHTKTWTERFGGTAQRDATASAGPTRATATADARLVWIGEDDRGIELEIVALDLNDAIVVVHVMPTALRRR